MRGSGKASARESDCLHKIRPPRGSTAQRSRETYTQRQRSSDTSPRGHRNKRRLRTPKPQTTNALETVHTNRIRLQSAQKKDTRTGASRGNRVSRQRRNTVQERRQSLRKYWSSSRGLCGVRLSPGERPDRDKTGKHDLRGSRRSSSRRTPL